MPRGAACGSALLVDPLSLLLVLRLLSCVRLCACSTCSGAVGRVFPTAVADVFQNRIAYFIALARLFRGAFVFRGGRTCFPGRDCVQVHCLLWEGVLGGQFLSRGSFDV